MSKDIKIKTLQDFIFNDEVQNILSEINDNVMDFNILDKAVISAFHNYFIFSFTIIETLLPH